MNIQALTGANTLTDPAFGLSDGSVAGDWYLPNIRELESLIDYTIFYPTLPSPNPFGNFQANVHWSSTTYYIRGYAWRISFDIGEVTYAEKTFDYFAHPVRGGS